MNNQENIIMRDESTIEQDVSNPPEPEKVSKLSAFKEICIRTGILIGVMFLLRNIGEVVGVFVARELIGSSLPYLAVYIILSFISMTFCYFLPIPIFMKIMKFKDKTEIRQMYKKPKKMAKAVGNFPAIYGFGQTINIITLVIGFFLMRDNNALGDVYNPITNLPAQDFYSGLFLFIQLTIFAPLFEEFLFRGVIMTRLMPYGNGFAIFMSAFIFGIAHGNLQQFFYTFAIGICFGYIFYATKSLISTIVLHLMLNSVAGIMWLFMSTQTVQDYIMKPTEKVPDDVAQNMILTLFGIFLVIMSIFILLGLILMIKKVIQIKKYRVESIWTEITNKKKTLIFFTSVTVIIGLLLTADYFSGQYIIRGLITLLGGTS